MWNTVKLTVKTLLMTPSAVIWTLLFPIVLSTVFAVMFGALKEGDAIEAVPVAVVQDDAWDDSGFAAVVESLAAGSDALLDVHAVSDAERARELLADGAVDGIYAVATDGTCRLMLPEAASAAQAQSDPSFEINRSILEMVASSYLQNEALLADAVAHDPTLLGKPELVERALLQVTSVRAVSLTHSQPDEGVRYFYALLGMTAVFAMQLAGDMVWRLQPLSSDTAARRAVSGTSRMRQLVPTVIGCWLVTTAFLLVAFAYMCAIAHIDATGRAGLCVVGIMAASLLSASIGACVGAMPGRMDAGARSGVLTVLSCAFSLFAGLYGTRCMELADAVAKAFPASRWINPVTLIRDMFYSIYYYDDLGPFLVRAAACAVAAAAGLAIAVALFRRQGNEHL